MELTPEQIAAEQAKAEEAAKAEAKKQARNEAMRELSQEVGFNIFDVEGIKAYKAFLDSQKTEQQKLQENVNSLTTEKEGWLKEKLELQTRLKATELGIHADNIDDALKLAGGDPNKLADVVKKYPLFKAKDGIVIGVSEQGKVPTGKTEAEQYMASNPRIYGKK